MLLIIFSIIIFSGNLFCLEKIYVPENIHQGNVLKIIVKSPCKCVAEFDGRVYPFFREGENLVSYIPVRAEISGKKKLKITEKFPFRKNKIFVEEISVEKRKFPSKKLRLSLEEIPKYPKKEKRKVKRTLSKFTKKKFFTSFSLPLKKFPITGRFGDRRLDREGRLLWWHKGIDIPAPTGTPVRPVSDGRVCLVVFNSPTNGNMVVIDHGWGIKSVYLHLDEVKCRVGDFLKKDDVLGTVGSTGIAEGPHLHLGIYLFGIPVNPEYAVKIFQ